jgi:hypothetical protein
MTRRLVAVVAGLTVVLSAVPLAEAATSVWFNWAISARHVRPSTVWLSADGTLVVQHVGWGEWGRTRRSRQGHGRIPRERGQSTTPP